MKKSSVKNKENKINLLLATAKNNFIFLKMHPTVRFSFPKKQTIRSHIVTHFFLLLQLIP